MGGNGFRPDILYICLTYDNSLNVHLSSHFLLNSNKTFSLIVVPTKGFGSISIFHNNFDLTVKLGLYFRKLLKQAYNSTEY